MFWKVPILNKKHGVKKNCSKQKFKYREWKTKGNKEASRSSYANREVKWNKILKVIKHVSLLIKNSKE